MPIGSLILGKARQNVLRWLASGTTSGVARIQEWFQKLNLINFVMVLHLLKQILKLLQIWFFRSSRVLLYSVNTFLRNPTLRCCWRLFAARKPSVSWKSLLILILKLETRVLIKAVIRYLRFRLCFIVFVVASQLVDKRLGHWVQRSHLIRSDSNVNIL